MSLLSSLPRDSASPVNKNGPILPISSYPFTNEATAYIERHYGEGGLSFLAESIHLFREVEKLPDQVPGHPDRPISLSFLGTAFLARYKKHGKESDLSFAIKLHWEALTLRPPGNLERSSSLENLADAVLARYERDGLISDLSGAIGFQRETLALRPAGHPERPYCLNNLANAIRKRCEREGGESDLSEVIALHREAGTLLSGDHPQRPTSLSNLAIALVGRYNQDGRASDLSEAINLNRESLNHLEPDHRQRPRSLNNLASALLTRYWREGEELDLTEGIDLLRQALDHLSPGDPQRPSALSNLAGLMHARYQRNGMESDLSEVIELYKKTLDLLPQGHPDRSTCLHYLGSIYRRRFLQDQYLSDLITSVRYQLDGFALQPAEHPLRSMVASVLGFDILDILRNARADPTITELGLSDEDTMVFLRIASSAKGSPLTDRLNAALLWIETAIEIESKSTIDAYRAAFTLWGSALTLNESLSARHRNLLSKYTRPPPNRGLALDAALWAINKDDSEPRLAVELLDQGRGALLASVGQFRADVSDVRRQAPELADEFSRISRLLDSAILTGQEISEKVSSHEDPISRYKRTSADWRTIVDQIRLLPGCELFLLPQPFVKLQEAAVEGPVIVIIVGEMESAAVIVMPEGAHRTVYLREASEEDLKMLYEDLEDAVGTIGDQRRAIRKLPGVLSRLWRIVVQPLVHELTEVLRIPLGSRIWWYPTSWASRLPLHAAGSYKKGGANLPDLYISSYTPTLQALRRSRVRSVSASDASTVPLIVSQAQAPGQEEILCVNEEAEVIRGLVPNASLLAGEHGTKESVLKELSNHSWIHMACHGHSDVQDPFQSHFALHDGPLSLQDIIINNLPSAEFAFLSACHSAAQDRTLPDEGLTLAGGMQFAGFKSVVGTLWEMADEDAPMLAETFYKSLARRSGKGQVFDCTKTAEALHEAVQKLRASKVPLFRWVNLVHYGI